MKFVNKLTDDELMALINDCISNESYGYEEFSYSERNSSLGIRVHTRVGERQVFSYYITDISITRLLIIGGPIGDYHTELQTKLTNLFGKEYQNFLATQKVSKYNVKHL